MSTWTASDIAIVLAAIGVLIPIVGNFVLSIAAFIRSGQVATTINATHDLVNGIAERKDKAIEIAAKLEGKAEGKAEGEAKAAAAIELAKAAITAKPPEQSAPAPVPIKDL